MFSGYFAAIVTPFVDGKVDLKSLEKYINYLVGSGVSGIVVCASTGEALSLSHQEKIDVITTAAKIADGKTRIIAGIVCLSTQDCFELMKKTESCVDAFLCVCPYYVRPSQEQIYAHFEKLSSSTSNKLILYNNPPRVGTSIAFDTLRRLSELNNIVGIKECGPDLSVFASWRLQLKEGFSLISGDDATACGALALGAEGIISVSANVIPEVCVTMYQALKRGEMERFSAARDMIAPVHSVMFEAPSPAPVKYVLSRLGYIQNELRLPMSPISEQLKAKIDDVMKKMDLKWQNIVK
ncbi:4-hydroxy-tetrahydrodipicolinate synthase [Alphaproteobacteria bacterium]|nr:4-hydroxy-tetrahydrodipicolinate synthase [Alphaproteobacteria bacterium]